MSGGHPPDTRQGGIGGVGRPLERLKLMEGGLGQATGRLGVGEYKLVLVWGAPEGELDGGYGLLGRMR